MRTEIDKRPEASSEDPLYRSAHKRAEELQGFYIHLLVYIAVNAGLFAVNALTRGADGSWWFYWPLVGWGIGLFIHTLATLAGLFSEDWKDRKASELYDRARRHSS
jgi:hypothetical protein